MSDRTAYLCTAAVCLVLLACTVWLTHVIRDEGGDVYYAIRDLPQG